MEFNSKDFLNDFAKNLASEKSPLDEEEFHKFLSLSPKRISNPFQADSYSTNDSLSLQSEKIRFKNIESLFSIPKSSKKTINVFDMDVTLGEIALHRPILKNIKKIKKTEPLAKEKKEGVCSGNGKWTEEESQLLYKAIEKYGTEFTIISSLFPNKTRQQIKNKYIKEEKANSSKIASLMENPATSRFKSNNLAEKISDFQQIQQTDSDLAKIEGFIQKLNDPRENFENEHDRVISNHLSKIMKEEMEEYQRDQTLKKLL